MSVIRIFPWLSVHLERSGVISSQKVSESPILSFGSLGEEGSTRGGLTSLTQPADMAAQENGAPQGPPNPLDHFVVVDGVVFPKFFQTNRPMKEQVECIKALELRDDDVLLLAYPKCGTHWLWEVASMLLAGKPDYHKAVKELAMLEATEIENTQALPSPRVLNTHVPASMLPREVKVKKVKVIHVYRNAKDVVVSMYFHAKQNPGMENFTVEMWLQEFISQRDRNGNYFAYLKSMDAWIKENPDIPVFNVSFEDTKEDQVGTVTRLAQFLGVAATPEFCRDVAEACSFQKMKDADKTKQQNSKLPPVQMYRKGEVGDWKNYITVAQSEQVDAAMKQLEGCDFHFRYTL